MHVADGEWEVREAVTYEALASHMEGPEMVLGGTQAAALLRGGENGSETREEGAFYSFQERDVALTRLGTMETWTYSVWLLGVF